MSFRTRAAGGESRNATGPGNGTQVLHFVRDDITIGPVVVRGCRCAVEPATQANPMHQAPLSGSSAFTSTAAWVRL